MVLVDVLVLVLSGGGLTLLGYYVGRDAGYHKGYLAGMDAISGRARAIIDNMADEMREQIEDECDPVYCTDPDCPIHGELKEAN